jgi:hypothetical protein
MIIYNPPWRIVVAVVIEEIVAVATANKEQEAIFAE